MKLSELKKIAREQDFNFSRITRVHSSLYRLASDIPETSEPRFFDSMSSVLLYATCPLSALRLEVIGTTKQRGFYFFRQYQVINVKLDYSGYRHQDRYF